MRLVTSLIPNDPADDVPAYDVAVVIDVLRATSVATVALAAGAAEILTCREIADARVLADASRGDATAALLCGERGCRPIDGFDLGNSPAEYSPERVAGRQLIFTTTNGTRAIHTAATARSMLLASFLNLSAVVEALSGVESVHLVCAGTDGVVTGEDVLLAGAIVDRCCSQREGDCTLDDASSIARSWWQSRIPTPDPASLAKQLAQTTGGRNLIRVGYESDLIRCAAIDTVPVVPRRSRIAPTGFTLAHSVAVQPMAFEK
ncbi:putative 2-phosphosulfolactate phosphatase [Rubripirellula tenax]|uniref:Probable 2-phosphosulfolactate phosphatase n=1 Tax=Rubripirellula tenax TaxID=2528015 RepID=A0A5C6ETG0_9BACT|nr:2-phosphosulfolactate phosphatase [Rubripirellula tenax]TWU50886.1 putative 2-phosphosulfolactate phosphatase [Rubripirellula tenax]